MDASSSPRTGAKRPRVTWSDEPVLETRTYLMSPEEKALKIEVFNEVQQKRKMLRAMVARAAHAIVASSGAPLINCATLLCSEDLHRIDADSDTFHEEEEEEQEQAIVQHVGSGCSSDEDGAATKPEPSVALVRPAPVARLRRGQMLVSKCLLPQRSLIAEDDAPAAYPYENATLLENATAVQNC